MRQQLSRVDDLRVEARGHLNPDDAGEQQKVHGPQVPLLVPGDGVIHRHAMDDIVGFITVTAAHGCGDGGGFGFW